MADKTTPEGDAAWSAYWSGRTDANADEVYSRPGIESDKEIATFWIEAIKKMEGNACIVDLACGSGSVIRIAHQLGFENLIGVDISPDAIALLMRRFPDVQGVVSSAAEIPLPDRSVDLIVSQFGLEYAGIASATEEVARLIAPNGRFIAMVHMTGGAIADESQRALDDSRAFAGTGFVPAARAVFVAIHEAEQQADSAEARQNVQAAIAALAGPRQAIGALAITGHKLAQHAMTGTQLMFERRRFYAIDDITDWLDKVHNENAAHISRMSGMLDAALNREEAESVLESLRACGFQTDPPEVFQQGTPREDIAWILSARRNPD